MKYRRSPKFKEDFEKLPQSIQNSVREKFRLFKENSYHPSLRIKKMQGYDNIWEGHLTIEYVFTFMRETDDETGEEIITFRRIGPHSIYRSP